MTYARARRACLFTALAWSAAVCAAPVQVQLAGEVKNAGTQTLKDHARLSDAALAAQPLPQAYMLGAAWLRPGLLESQQRLKAGVLFDLSSLHLRAAQRSDEAMAQLANSLHSWVTDMPVTGRLPALLDPRTVEVTAEANPPLADGDRVYYPLRPTTIRVVGAVHQTCTLSFRPLQAARSYLSSCASTRQADRNWIFVIEPDGRVFRQGIALWNPSAPLVLAPGALIYVPIRERVASAIDPTLNRDLADFLATQILPATGTAP